MDNSLPIRVLLIASSLLLIANYGTGVVNSAVVRPNGTLRFEPVSETKYRPITPLFAEGSQWEVERRRLAGPFQLCLVCKCCAAASPTPTCSTMPCCFAIDCQLPGKPFGVCAFVPKTCDCTSCAV